MQAVKLQPSVAPALDQALGGRRLSFDQGLALLTAPSACHADILEAANVLRRRLHGDRTTYIINRNLCFTNVCYVGCLFCNFAVPQSDATAFHLSEEEARLHLTERTDTTEVCMQGGIDPKWGLEEYARLLDWVRAVRPDIHIHAFSAEEIHHAVRKSGKSVREALEFLKGRGLDSLPGTAAEIFHPEVRSQLCPEKIGADRWFEIHREAHRLGLPSTATMLFGHIESPAHIVDHMLRIRDLQNETGGFTEFVPLMFIHPRTALRDWEGRHRMDRREYVERTYAVARLFFGEAIPHLQTSWVKLGIPKALETLAMGCDDFGGSLFEERITACAGGESGDKIEPADIVAHLQRAGYRPAQRTTDYRIL